MNNDTKEEILEAYEIIHKMDISSDSKSRLIDLVEETLNRHEAIEQNYESTKEALVRMNTAQVQQVEKLTQAKSLLQKASEGLLALKALLTFGKGNIDA